MPCGGRTGCAGGAHTTSTGCDDPGRLDDRRVPEQPRPALGVRRRRRRHQAQLRPQRGPHVQQEGGRGVRVEVALVALVEDDDVDAGQLLVALQALEEHAGGDDLDARVSGPTRRSPRTVKPTRLARLLAEQPGHPAGGGPGRYPARLGDHDPPHRAVAEQPREHQRHQRGLARAGRRAQHGRPVPVERGQQLGHGLAYGQSVEGVGSHHALSVVRRGGPCGALSTGTVGLYD